MTNGDYMRNCSDYGMAKEILSIARETCKGCGYSICDGIENCELFSERYGSPWLAEWLQEERNVRSKKSE